MRVWLGADEHGPLLDAAFAELGARGHEVTRVGATTDAPCPWAEVALTVARAVADGRADQGIVACWTGTGVSIAANKVRGVRAALATDAETARGARRWNDANVLALGMRLTTPALAREIVAAWLDASYEGTEGASLDALRDAESGAR